MEEALLAAVPVAGWLFTLARYDLWGSGFAFMAAFWVLCAASAAVVRHQVSD